MISVSYTILDFEVQMFTAIDEPDHRRQLRDSVSGFILRDASASQARPSTAHKDGFVPERWRAMAEMGWLGLLVPEDLGGVGLGASDLSAFHQEIGRAALGDPLIEVTTLAMQALALGSNLELSTALLPDLIEGATLATFVWQSRPDAMTAIDVELQAQVDGDSWVLSGHARFVPLGQCADGAVVAAKSAEGVMLFWVDTLPDPGDIAPQSDRGTLSALHFDSVRVPADKVIADTRDGARLLDVVLDTARLAASAQLLGAMEHAFMITLEYLKTREQFGRPLAAFQALQHRIVDLFVQIEIARSALMRAELAFEHTASAARASMVSAAKSRCSDAAMRVTREAIQLHGAIGYTDEHDLSRYVKRTLVLASRYGTARAHRTRWLNDQFPMIGAADDH